MHDYIRAKINIFEFFLHFARLLPPIGAAPFEKKNSKYIDFSLWWGKQFDFTQIALFSNFGILWAKIRYLLKFCTWVMVTIILFKRIFAAIGIFHCANMILNIHSTMQCTRLKLYFVRTLFQLLQLIWEPPSHSISLLGIFTFCCHWEYIYFWLIFFKCFQISWKYFNETLDCNLNYDYIMLIYANY